MTLFEAVCDSYNLDQAWMAVRGKRTLAARQQGAGVDGVTVADWEQNWPARLRALQTALLEGAYHPSSLLWFDAPRRPPLNPARSRGGSKGKRRLGIPTVTDRVAQRAVLRVLEPLWEDVFLSCSHGFRPGRSVFTAVAHVLWHAARGLRWVADADIASFFDTISHERLLRQLAALDDERVLSLLAGWLAVGAAAPGRGVAQGAVISPLLANVYLHPFDAALVQAGWAPVRYADDVVVLCADPDQALQALAHVNQALADLDLALNEAKTAVVPFGPGFSFLGATFDD